MELQARSREGDGGERVVSGRRRACRVKGAGERQVARKCLQAVRSRCTGLITCVGSGRRSHELRQRNQQTARQLHARRLCSFASGQRCRVCGAVSHDATSPLFLAMTGDG
jgi:hypothetical protein